MRRHDSRLRPTHSLLITILGHRAFLRIFDAEKKRTQFHRRNTTGKVLTRLINDLENIRVIYLQSCDLGKYFRGKFSKNLSVGLHETK